MNTVLETIPYEKQADAESSRMCGAACLSMVYRSFGKDIPQSEIWPLIAKVNRFGSMASTTHLMAKDALGRGLSALAIQARHPIQALQLCHEAGIRAILNHRAGSDSPAGHYSVMVDLCAKNVVLHDPFFGPSRRIRHGELLDLWQPKFPNSEIVGGVLIAVAEAPPEVPPCQFCHTPTPPAVVCPNCQTPVGLKPAQVLGCMNQNCIARMWNYICCPACDFMWGFDSRLEPAAAEVAVTGPPARSLADDIMHPEGLNEALEAVDKFTDHIKRIPNVAEHVEVKHYLDLISGAKAKLKLDLAEAALHARAQEAQLAACALVAYERAEAHRKRVEEINKQVEARKAEANKKAEALDGVALGKALLKHLGFMNRG